MATLNATRAAQLRSVSSFEEQKCLAGIDALTQVSLSDTRVPADLRKQLSAIGERATDAASEAGDGDNANALRIYVFVSEESQRAVAPTVADKLSALKVSNRDVIVLGVNLIQRAPSGHVIWCFTDQDCAAAPGLFDGIERFIASPALKVEMAAITGSGRTTHFAIWFSPWPATSSGAAGTPAHERAAAPTAYSHDIVDRDRSPQVPYLSGTRPAAASTARKVVAIIIHDARTADNVVGLMRTGRSDLPGPLAHWAVQSDGTVVFIADVGVKANHVGLADSKAITGLANSNTIGIHATGTLALAKPVHIENHVRMLVGTSERWGIAPTLILGHGVIAVPAGRNTELLHQAPVLRQMLEAYAPNVCHGEA